MAADYPLAGSTGDMIDVRHLVAVGDHDGNGDLDIATAWSDSNGGGSWGSEVLLRRSLGSDAGATSGWSGDDVRYSALASGDLGGDGCSEFFVGGADYSDGADGFVDVTG